LITALEKGLWALVIFYVMIFWLIEFVRWDFVSVNDIKFVGL